MRAVAYKIPQPISAETSLVDVDLPTPEAKGRDLLVEIKAVSVNPGGSNAEFQLVDERIVGLKPKSLDFAAAAALPLTSITAYEVLFDRLKVQDPVAGVANTILIIGGAGGVGSIAIQLARVLADLTIVATASRPETRE